MQNNEIRFPITVAGLENEIELKALVQRSFKNQKGELGGPLRELLNVTNGYRKAALQHLQIQWVKILGRTVKVRYFAEFMFTAEKENEVYFVESSHEVTGRIEGLFLVFDLAGEADPEPASEQPPEPG
ncbi:hypothetical protein WAE61_01465 [Comamonadaceae bacterium PP-2]